MSRPAAGSDQDGAEGVARPARKKAKEGKEEDDMMAVVLKLSLSTALVARQLQAATVRVMIVSVDNAVCAAMMERGKWYQAEVESKGRREHDLGSPHTYIFGEMITHLRDHTAVADPDRQALAQLWSKIENLPTEKIAEFVAVCRLAGTFDKKEKKLLLAMCEPSWSSEVNLAPMQWNMIEPLLVRAMVATGAKLKTGLAPMSALERAAQRCLDRR